MAWLPLPALPLSRLRPEEPLQLTKGAAEAAVQPIELFIQEGAQVVSEQVLHCAAGGEASGPELGMVASAGLVQDAVGSAHGRCDDPDVLIRQRDLHRVQMSARLSCLPVHCLAQVCQVDAHSGEDGLEIPETMTGV